MYLEEKDYKALLKGNLNVKKYLQTPCVANDIRTNSGQLLFLRQKTISTKANGQGGSVVATKQPTNINILQTNGLINL